MRHQDATKPHACWGDNGLLDGADVASHDIENLEKTGELDILDLKMDDILGLDGERAFVKGAAFGGQ